MRKNIFLSMVLTLSILGFAGTAYGQTPVSPTLTRAMSRTLGEKPQMILWADLNSLKSSGFFTPMKKFITKLIKSKLSSKKITCINILTPNNVNYALAAMSDTDKKKKERGIIVIQGSFSASKFIKCLAKENKWVKTSFKGYPAYKDKDKIYFTPSMGSLVSVMGKWKKKVKPNVGTIGKGNIKPLKSSKFIIVDIRKSKSLKPMKYIKLYGTLGSTMKFKFESSTAKSKDAKKIVDQVTKLKKMGGFFQQITTSLHAKRSGKKVVVNYSMTITQLKTLISTVGPFIK